MDTPCQKCFTITVQPSCQAWVDSLEVQKSDPDVTIAGESLVSSTSAFNFYQNLCAALSGTWAECAEPLTCWICTYGALFFGVDNMGPDVNFCNYTATISFPNVTLAPPAPWAGDAFTLVIASNDPRITFSPASFEITNGFSDPIVLTLTLAVSNPVGVTVLSDLAGVCSVPTLELWAFDTTPQLTC